MENKDLPESIDPRRAQLLQHRLRIRATLGIVLISAVLGLTSAALLYRAHIDSLKQELLFNTELQSNTLGAEVSRLRNIVVQITSRTRIRQELEKFNAGHLDRAALVDFSAPKLADVMRLTPEIEGIARLGLNGVPVIEVGKAIPPEFWPPEYLGTQPAVGTVFNAHDQSLLVVSAPIRNREGEPAGTDLALFDTRRLDATMSGFFERLNGLGRVQLVARHQAQAVSFLARGDQNVQVSAETLLAEWLEAMQGVDEGVHTSGPDELLIAHHRIKDTPWALLYINDQSEFYAPARQQALYVLLAFIVLTIIGIVVTNRITQPVTGKILVGTQSLFDLLGEKRQLLARISENETQLQAIIDNAPAVIYAKNADGSYRLVNAAYERFSGLKREQIVGRTDHELFPSDIADRFRQNDLHVIEVDHPVQSDEQAPHGDDIHDYLSIKFPLKNEDSATFGICGISTDITERKQHERQLRQLAAAYENSGEAILITDADGNIIDVNPAFRRILGYDRKELIGRNPNLLKSGEQDKHFYELMWEALQKKGCWRGEIWNKRKDGSLIPMLSSITRIDDEFQAVVNYVAVYSDISALKQSEARLSHLAHHDALTDLPNRVMLDVRMEHSIQYAERSGKRLAVIFLDLDHFKNVNDSLGHAAGDQLLTQIAELLKGSLRTADTVARVSGDEFVLLLEDIDTTDTVIQIVEKILNSLDRPFQIADQAIRVTASLGISLFPDDGKDRGLLLRNADAAMYLAKSEGRNTYNFYTEELTRRAFDRMQLETRLRQAITDQSFQLHYQPQIDLRTGRIAGLEALIRWIDTDGNFIAPDQFIPIAEHSDLIHPLGRWIINTACAQAAAWLEQGLSFGRMAINISGKQVSAGDLVDDIEAALSESGLPPEYIELELTESFVMGELRGAIDVLNRLRARQIMLTVDDFGTGYSSLAYLKSLPVQRLKIDRSFVRDIPDDSNDMAITEAVIALGKSLQLEIVAEGVETQEQYDFLQAHGCQLGQGYLFSRPLPPDEITRLLNDQTWASPAHG